MDFSLQIIVTIKISAHEGCSPSVAIRPQHDGRKLEEVRDQG